jgi:hypothetical protein
LAKSSNLLTAISIIAIIVLLGGGIYILSNINTLTKGIPSYLTIAITIIAGVVVLLSILVISTYVLNSIGLSSQTDSLGLPNGSIRAIIAISLILIFAILVIFMFQYLVTPTQTVTMTYFSNTTIGNQTITNSTSTTYSVPSQGAIDFAKQTLTALLTLVTAISAFYFGSKAASEAKGQEECDLSIDPVKVDWIMGGEPIIISAWPTPKDAEVTCEVDGDKPGTTVALVPNKKFKYTPSLTEPKEVVLTFRIPNVSSLKPLKTTINILKPGLKIDQKDQTMKEGSSLTINVTPTPDKAKVICTSDLDAAASIKEVVPSKQFIYTTTKKDGDVVTLTFTMPEYTNADPQKLKLTIKKP